MDLGKILKEARKKAGYSQKDVAEKLNISRQAISRWENGWAAPDIDNLSALSQMYKISVDDLLENHCIENLQMNPQIENHNIERGMEQFFIVAIALLSCTVPVAGLALNIGLCVYCLVKKINLNPICWIVLIYCVVINISNLYTVLSIEIPSWGHGSVEKISGV